MTVYQLPDEPHFPPVEEAEADGLIAIGGDLSPRRLISAYAQGIFPWFSEQGEPFWFSPDPRLVLFPDEFKVPRSLARVISSQRYEVRFDNDFRAVIEGCAAKSRPGQEGTWITADFIDAYCALHKLGFAHSVACYRDGALAGGLYGVSLGTAYFGESMFSLLPDASKVALYHLTRMLGGWGFSVIDCQADSPHLHRLGARLISRGDYLKIVETALASPTKRGRWSAVPESTV